MANQIQVSIGAGSMGLVYKTADAGDLPALFAMAAAAMGYTAEVVEAKLRAGGTLWLNRAEGQKIRGYDAEAVAAAAQKRDVERAARLRADGYLNDE